MVHIHSCINIGGLRQLTVIFNVVSHATYKWIVRSEHILSTIRFFFTLGTDASTLHRQLEDTTSVNGPSLDLL